MNNVTQFRDYSAAISTYKFHRIVQFFNAHNNYNGLKVLVNLSENQRWNNPLFVKETYQKQLAILASFEQQLEPVQILVASNLDGSAVVLTERDFGECLDILKS
jgi:hypothetical protein